MRTVSLRNDRLARALRGAPERRSAPRIRSARSCPRRSAWSTTRSTGPTFRTRRSATPFDVFLPMAYFTYRVQGPRRRARATCMRSVALLARRCRRGRPGARDRRRRGLGVDRGRAGVHGRGRPLRARRLQPLRLPDHLRRRPGRRSPRRRPGTASGRVLRAADSLSTLARDARDRREQLPTRSPSATREHEERDALAARRALVRDARPRAGRRRNAPSGRPSSATATGSSTRRRSGASRARRRCSSTPSATTTARA